jgi:hypothetical protein
MCWWLSTSLSSGSCRSKLQRSLQIEWLLSSVTSYTILASPTLSLRIWDPISNHISSEISVNAVPLKSNTFQWYTRGLRPGWACQQLNSWWIEEKTLWREQQKGRQVDQWDLINSLGLRTQPSKATGHSPFFLIYGSATILPADVMWKSLRLEMFEEGEADTARHLEFDSAEEIRCNVLVQSALYLQEVHRYHDRNVQRRSFNVGDMVLRRI